MNTDHALIDTKPTSLRYAKDFITEVINKPIKERAKKQKTLFVKTIKQF